MNSLNLNELKYKKILDKTVLATVSHEIKNPLTIIISLTNSLKKAIKERKIKEAESLLEILQEEAYRILHIVNNLLEYSKIDRPSFTSFSIKELIEEIKKEIKSLYNEKRPEIEIECEEKIKVTTDRYLLKQAIFNIVDNSVTISENPKIDIEVFHDSSKRHVIINISDNGPGIKTDSFLKIFEPFFSTKPTGIGLGLYIVKKIMEALEGDIAIKSKLGEGTSFFLILPNKL